MGINLQRHIPYTTTARSWSDNHGVDDPSLDLIEQALEIVTDPLQSSRQAQARAKRKQMEQDAMSTACGYEKRPDSADSDANTGITPWLPPLFATSDGHSSDGK